MASRTQARLYAMLEQPDPQDRVCRLIDAFLIVLILLNVAGMMLESEPAFAHWREPLRTLAAFTVGLFTIEYLLRLWAAPADKRYAKPIRGRIRFALRFFSVVDLLAIVPFYVAWSGGDEEMASLIRVLWIVKLGRHSAAIRLLGGVFRSQRRELMATGFVLLVLLLLASCAIYLVENEAQPEAFRTIPTAIWWSIITITTVGYGDVYPVTTAGKFVGAFVAVIGVLAVALPTSILASGFHTAFRSRDAIVTCAHCGQTFDSSSEKRHDSSES